MPGEFRNTLRGAAAAAALAGAIALIGAFALAPAGARPKAENMQPIAASGVTTFKSSDFDRVAIPPTPLHSVQLCATRNAVEFLEDPVLVLSDGTRVVEAIERRIALATCSRLIEIKDGPKILLRMELRYRNAEPGDRARVFVFGR